MIPQITPSPVLKLAKRDGISTCGYFDARQNQPFTCPPTSTCRRSSFAAAWGCENALHPLSIGACRNGDETNTLRKDLLNCAGSSPYCNTLILDNSMTTWTCGPTAQTLYLYQTFTDEGSATQAAFTGGASTTRAAASSTGGPPAVTASSPASSSDGGVSGLSHDQVVIIAAVIPPIITVAGTIWLGLYLYQRGKKDKKKEKAEEAHEMRPPVTPTPFITNSGSGNANYHVGDNSGNSAGDRRGDHGRGPNGR
ncbi:hypothetical protein B0H63DRAFT_487040 [Podospora didyma]|uniref:Uncharacterized protein n=1 Tax=Podospora didyma TaxID=330526 RepID=A0AAE0K6A5_9PEZI|nr:hypothetical protein B0H63DRAFT_487040 [Podospora didyma]